MSSKEFKITKHEEGICEACGEKKQVQKGLLVKKGVLDDDYDYAEDSDREYYPICKRCFVLPEYGDDWDYESICQDLNQREAIWENGNWDVEEIIDFVKPRLKD